MRTKKMLTLMVPEGTYGFVRDFFQENAVRSYDELEQALKDWHKDFRDKTPMEGKKRCKDRTRGENLTDWVKATITRNGMATSLYIQDSRFFIYLPACGKVDGNTLCHMDDAWHTVRCLLARFDSSFIPREQR
jgi:hypothetical protein